MHLWRLWLVSGLFAVSAAGAAVVYKWTDSAGVIHFSDQPEPGAETIVTSAGTSNGIRGQFADAATGPVPGTSGQKKPPPGGLGYTEVSIDSPGKDQVFFGDDTVSVHLHLAPGLQPNNTVSWRLNGQLLDDRAGALSFSLPAMSRGTYAIDATVTDPATGSSRSADSVTFYIRQPSALAPQHKKN